MPAIDRAIAEAIEEFRPDCIHAQHLLNLSTGLLDAGRAAGAPVALTLHDYWLTCPRDGLRMRADGARCAASITASAPTAWPTAPTSSRPIQRGATRAAQAAGLGGALHGPIAALPP